MELHGWEVVFFFVAVACQWYIHGRQSMKNKLWRRACDQSHEAYIRYLDLYPMSCNPDDPASVAAYDQAKAKADELLAEHLRWREEANRINSTKF